MLNLNHPVQVGPIIYNIYDFNREVIRESILNSYEHRDYTLTSDVVIRQYPKMIEIINPGGFPKGVTIDNILTVSSTPRNKLIADVLEKTGLVERSGQGVDKIFAETLLEGKKLPDYSYTNPFQVTLRIRSQIIDESFIKFVHRYQNAKNKILGSEQIIILAKIRDKSHVTPNPEIIAELKQMELIKSVADNADEYRLSDEYANFAENSTPTPEKETKPVKQIYKNASRILALIKQNSGITAYELMKELSLSESAVRKNIAKLVDHEVIKRIGSKKNGGWQIVEST
jgi:ATP-dependent DNA helicase RecG